MNLFPSSLFSNNNNNGAMPYYGSVLAIVPAPVNSPTSNSYSNGGSSNGGNTRGTYGPSTVKPKTTHPTTNTNTNTHKNRPVYSGSSSGKTSGSSTGKTSGSSSGMTSGSSTGAGASGPGNSNPSSSGCIGFSGNVDALTEENNGSSNTVSVGDTIVIALAGQPSTGYHWQPIQVPPQLKELVNFVVPNDSGLIGGPETEVYVFQAQSSGSGPLALLYEFQGQVANSFSVDVTVM